MRAATMKPIACAKSQRMKLPRFALKREFGRRALRIRLKKDARSQRCNDFIGQG